VSRRKVSHRFLSDNYFTSDLMSHSLRIFFLPKKQLNFYFQVLPVDQTPTPTKIIKLASELFPAESNNTANTVTAAKSENTSNSSQPNPFDKSFKQSTSQSPENGTNSGNEPVIQELENVDQNMEEDHDGDHEFVEEIVDEEEIEEASEKFKVFILVNFGHY
jgi:hypothetical protein